MSGFAAQIRRDLAIAWAGRLDIAVMLAFFVMIVTLFPLALGPDAAILKPLAVPIIWIAALLSILAGFDRLFAGDVWSGWLDQVALSSLSLPYYVVAKAIAHWLVAGLPVLLATPIMGLLLQIDYPLFGGLLLSLLLGTMGLTLLGVIGASLAQGARRGGGLMALLILPLAVPILIFGVLASSAATLYSPHLLLLGAVLALLLALAPPVAAAALRDCDEEAGQ